MFRRNKNTFERFLTHPQYGSVNAGNSNSGSSNLRLIRMQRRPHFAETYFTPSGENRDSYCWHSCIRSLLLMQNKFIAEPKGILNSDWSLRSTVRFE